MNDVKKVYLFEKEYGNTDIVFVNGYGKEKNVKDAADKVVKLLLNDISSHAFELAMAKLRERGFIK